MAVDGVALGLDGGGRVTFFHDLEEEDAKSARKYAVDVWRVDAYDSRSL